MVLFNIGTLFKTPAGTAVKEAIPFPKTDKYAYILTLAYFIVSMLYIQSITGKNPFLPSSYSLDFGDVYRDFGKNLRYREAGIYEVFITSIKGILFPFVLLVFVDRFGKNWLIIISILIPLVISSFLRGTDKEIFDLLLLVGITAYYKNLIGWRVLVYAPLIPIFAALFLFRRLGRFNDVLPPCLPNSNACFNYQSNVAKTFGDSAETLYVFITNYVTQGYEALSLTFDQKFDFNFLLGHLPPLKRNFCIISDYVCNIPDYQQKLTGIGWDTSTRWTSVYPVLANDISFWLVPFYFLMMGYMFQKSMVLWKNGRDLSSLVAIILITNFIIFSSANMQVAISLDWAVCLIVFIYFGLFRRTVGQR